jgi:hypothetical protein
VIEEQNAKDPIIEYVEQLKEEYKTVVPLAHELIYGSPDEWSNIP